MFIWQRYCHCVFLKLKAAQVKPRAAGQTRNKRMHSTAYRTLTLFWIVNIYYETDDEEE